jgi:hypothetical protein
MRFFPRFFIITGVVAANVDWLYIRKQGHYGISLPVFLLAIAGMVIPIIVNIWNRLPKYGIVP